MNLRELVIICFRAWALADKAPKLSNIPYNILYPYFCWWGLNSARKSFPEPQRNPSESTLSSDYILTGSSIYIRILLII